MWYAHIPTTRSESKNSFELESASSEIPVYDTNIDISFFPEGGFLLVGVQNLVAFKAINQNGKGIPVSGRVLNKSLKPTASGCLVPPNYFLLGNVNIIYAGAVGY